MDIAGSLRRIGRTMQVRQVFGEPVENAGTLVIPVAAVRGTGGVGGGGGQRGHQDTGTGGEAGGSVFLSHARPVGVFVVRADGSASWRPVVDLNRIILGSQLIVCSHAAAIVTVVMVRSVLRRRPRGGG